MINEFSAERSGARLVNYILRLERLKWKLDKNVNVQKLSHCVTSRPDASVCLILIYLVARLLHSDGLLDQSDQQALAAAENAGTSQAFRGTLHSGVWMRSPPLFAGDSPVETLQIVRHPDKNANSPSLNPLICAATVETAA